MGFDFNSFTWLSLNYQNSFLYEVLNILTAVSTLLHAMLQG